jgi:cytochrome c oxidase assembly protein subunit 11
MNRRGRNLTIALIAVVPAISMLVLTLNSPPLYRLFCSVTGYGGTPQVGPAESNTVSNRTITVRFNADTSAKLPWRFEPAQNAVKVKLGHDQVAFYTAKNLAAEPVTGIAVYNVTPDKAGQYFHKTACFCFNQQTLTPGEEMQFPLSFWVDPKIATDPATADIKAITLSYTFFRSLDDAAKSGALAKAGPHVGEDPNLKPTVVSR